MSSFIASEAAKSARELLPKQDESAPRVTEIPLVGLQDGVIKMLQAMKDRDTHAEKGKLFGYVYTMDGGRYQVG